MQEFRQILQDLYKASPRQELEESKEESRRISAKRDEQFQVLKRRIRNPPQRACSSKECRSPNKHLRRLDDSIADQNERIENASSPERLRSQNDKEFMHSIVEGFKRMCPDLDRGIMRNMLNELDLSAIDHV